MADRNSILNDQEQAMRLMLDGRQSLIWTCCPGIVESVDWAQMTCEVQPAIQGIVSNEDGTQTFVNLPLLLDVPIVFPSAGGFTITMPLAAGNEVLVVFASRCIDAWWQSGGIQKPIEYRMHDLSDGFAFPGPKSLPNVVPAISTTALQIRNDVGTSYIEMSADGKIKLVSPVALEITGDVLITGDLAVTGEVTGGPTEIPLTTHTHLSSSPGDPTGPPIP